MKILVGDILQSKAQTLINTVNCVGIMGKGIALEFKKHFSEMFEDYVQRCRNREVRPGMPYLYKALLPPQIINFPTKDHWKSVSKISDIERGLDFLLAHYKEWSITSLAVPPLGCGNGQLEWRIMGPLIYQRVKQMDVPIKLYAPYGTNPKELTIAFLEQEAGGERPCTVKMIQSTIHPAWVALVEILSRIEKQPYHWPVGRTVFQKIVYVATHEGLPTGFHYQRGSFGPFSKELKGAETKLINSNLLQEERLGRMFMVKVGPGFEAAQRQYHTALAQWTNIIEKTTDLFVRMNTDQAEIVATVLFSANELKKSKNEKPSENEVLDFVMQWKQKRRPVLDQVRIASAIRNLGMLHRLDVKPDASLPVGEEDAVTA